MCRSSSNSCSPPHRSQLGLAISFAIGALAAQTVMWLRRTMDESENFKLAVEEGAERGSLKILLSYSRSACQWSG